MPPAFRSLDIQQGYARYTPVQGQFETGGGLLNLGAQLYNAASGLRDNAAREAIVTGKKAGAIAAVELDLSKPPPLRGGSSQEDIAFDAELSSGYAARVELGMRQAINRANVESPNDPQAMAKNLQAWSSRVKESMPAQFIPAFDLKFQTLASSHLLSAQAKMNELADKGDKDILGALAGQMSADMQGYGRVFMEAGGAGPQALGALGGARSTFETAVGQIQASIAANRMDPRSGAAQLRGFADSANENLIRGMFDGAKDKGAFLDDFVSGRLVAPTVKVEAGEEGKVMMGLQSGDPTGSLSLKQRTELRSYMDAAVDAQWQRRDRARSIETQRAEDEGRGLLNAIYSSTDPAKREEAYKLMQTSPVARVQDKIEADRIMRDLGPARTDWGQYTQIENSILTGQRYSLSEMQRWQISRSDRAKLETLQTEVENVAAAPIFKDALQQIQLEVGRFARTVVGITGEKESAVAAKRNEASAVLEGELRRQVIQYQRGGYSITGISTGEAVQINETAGIKAFDPYNWVRSRLTEASAKIKPQMEAQKVLQDEIRTLSSQVSVMRQRNEKGTKFDQASARLSELQNQLRTSTVDLADVILGAQ
jgi:hypothetical protein